MSSSNDKKISLNNIRHDLKLFLKIMSFAKPYWIGLIVVLVLIVIEVSFDVFFAKIQELFIDNMNSQNAEELVMVIKISVIFALVIVFCIFFQYLIRFYNQWLQIRDVAGHLFEKINHVPYSYLQDKHSADLLSRISNDVGQSVSLIWRVSFQLFFNIVMTIFAFAYLLTIDVSLAILAVSSGPLLFLLGRFFDKKLRNVTRGIQNKNAEVRGGMQEVLQGISTVKAFSLENSFHSEIIQKRREQNEEIKRSKLLRTAMDESTNTLLNLLIIVSIFLICFAVVEGELTAGTALAFIYLMMRVQVPFAQLSRIWSNIQESLGASERVLSVLHEDTEKVQPNSSSIQEGFNNAIAISNLSLSFNEKESNIEKQILSGINLNIKAQEFVAVVGPSGSGKTSLARICTGLYQNYSGEVRMFGNELRNHTNDVSSLVSYVPQTPYLFSGTIRDNISCGMEDVTEEDILKAAKAANAHDFITAFKNKYDTEVKELGTSLSVGQMQRITIARAFITDSPIIILDEPTSALDNQGNKYFYEGIQRLAVDKTLMVISHRISTIVNADRILVMDKGKIVAQGSHDELLNENLLYKSLYNSM